MDSSIRSIPESVFVNCFEECGFEYKFDQNDNSFEEQLFSANNWEQINERLKTGLHYSINATPMWVRLGMWFIHH
jgi:hypothetical protein